MWLRYSNLSFKPSSRWVTLGIRHRIDRGEVTGELPNMLNQIPEIYGEEVAASNSVATSVIEPFLILKFSISILAIVFLLFLPFINLMQNIAQQVTKLSIFNPDNRTYPKARL